ncbi:MAG: DUF4197 domain-containing protein [Casimicrobiaceae bacterium]
MRILLFAALVACLCGTASAQFPDLKGLLKGAPSAGVSDGNAAAGLKEALQVSAGNAVDLTGREGGYFRNELIRIAMPENLALVDKGLRLVGYGPQVDAFVLSMNRAAEKAAPAARDIFVGAIRQMTFDDARRILGGNDNAATEYFRAKTSDGLKSSFRPIVERSMADSGVTRQYDDLVSRYRSVPFASSVSFDLDDYVVRKAMDGLFLVIGQEEKRIRTDPAARVTDLLKGTFGR